MTTRTPSKSKDKVLRAVSYARVSTIEQSIQGVSLDVQKETIERYLKYHRMEWVDHIIDPGVSASKPLKERPGGSKLLTLTKRKDISVVVVFKLDRLFRDAADCLHVTKEWDARDISLHLIDMGGQSMDSSRAMGRFFLTIMAAVAEMERNLISERIKASMAHLKRQGKRVGAIPYGYRLGRDQKTLHPRPNEQRVVQRIHLLRERGFSLRKISAILAKEEIFSRSGQPFHPEQLRRVLLTPPLDASAQNSRKNEPNIV